MGQEVTGVVASQAQDLAGPGLVADSARSQLLHRLVMAELRQALRHRGLPVGGLKEDLVRRLMNDKEVNLPPERCCSAIFYVADRTKARLAAEVVESQPKADAWMTQALARSS